MKARGGKILADSRIPLLLALVVAGPIAAQDDFVWALEDAYEFVEFHDPGYLVLKDSTGKESELQFGYEDLSYEVVQAWPKTKQIRVAYSPEDGTEVIDPESGARYPIRSARPRVDLLLERCLAQRVTTSGMAACYAEGTLAWDVELNRAYQNLMQSRYSEETRLAIRKAQRAWVEFRDTSIAAIGATGREQGGTIQALAGGSSILALTRDQALRLLAYLP